MNLDAIQTIISHDSCADGTASALLIHKALPKAEILFIQYGTNAYKNLPATPGMLFCDFSPPPDRVQEFVDAGAIVLDHHKTAQGIVASFGDRGVFGDEITQPGISGAVLAYEHIWKPILGADSQAEAFARLAGVRDTWLNQHPDWKKACAQAAILRFRPNSEWLADSFEPENWDQKYLWVGEMLYSKHLNVVAKAVSKAWRYQTPKGTRVAILSGGSATSPLGPLVSDAAELMGSEVDLVVEFFFTYEPGQAYPTLVFSTRSHTDFDCGAFCKANGGGGHTKAAGFGMEITPTSKQPYRIFDHRLMFYEKGYAETEALFEALRLISEGAARIEYELVKEGGRAFLKEKG